MITLKQVTTKELIAQLHTYYNEGKLVFSRVGKGGAQEYLYVDPEDVRKELQGRPHVPSKREAKLIRKLKAQTGRTEADLRKDRKYGPMIVEADLGQPRKRVMKEEYVKLEQIYGRRFVARRFVIG